MQKLIVLVFFGLLFNTVAAQKVWGKDIWKVYMNTCIEEAKTGMSNKDARNYCECTGEKLEVMYPNAADLTKLTADEINELARVCLSEINKSPKGDIAPDPPANTKTAATNWSATSYEAYMKSCIDSAKETFGFEKSKEYCACTAYKLQILYPDETKLGDLTQNVIEKVAMECLK